MPASVVLCPWVAPPPYMGAYDVSSRLTQVEFEFEQHGSVPATEIADVIRARLNPVRASLDAHGFSVLLPIQSDPEFATLWAQATDDRSSLDVRMGRARPGEFPDLVVALLTLRSPSTLIESAVFATTGWAAQVCVGIDMPVPSLLARLPRVWTVNPSDGEAQLLSALESASGTG